ATADDEDADLRIGLEVLDEVTITHGLVLLGGSAGQQGMSVAGPPRTRRHAEVSPGRRGQVDVVGLLGPGGRAAGQQAGDHEGLALLPAAAAVATGVEVPGIGRAD